MDHKQAIIDCLDRIRKYLDDQDADKAEPVYDRAVWQASGIISARPIENSELLHVLQNVFDAGREAGADQEALALGKRTEGLVKDPESLKRYWEDRGAKPWAQDSASSTLGQTHAAEARYPRPNDEPISELYREPIVQCPECLTAIYPGEGHSCRGYTR